MIISDFNSIQTELQEMQTYLEAHYEIDNPQACVNRALDIGVYMARSGKLLADAEYHRDGFLNGAIADTIKAALEDGGWPAKVIQDKISALAKDYNIVCKWAERVNRTCTHQNSTLITVLSKHKEEMKMNQYGGGGNQSRPF